MNSAVLHDAIMYFSGVAVGFVITRFYYINKTKEAQHGKEYAETQAFEQTLEDALNNGTDREVKNDKE